MALGRKFSMSSYTYYRPPPIEAVQGDQIVIHAYNGLGDKTVGTALHSHGMFFNGTSYYDGAVGITQCSIPSETGMDYIIDTSLQVSNLNSRHVLKTCDLFD
jgi:FtsP/CotA-like multicopper oxidase with cupredoxin domain